ncbi:MAG: glutathione S-transferase N-terminal domain-containing protein [Actinomycetota bacterium]
MSIRLYVVPGSNPSMAARLMLEYKRLPYRRVDLIPTVHMAFLRAAGFRRATVPAMRIDGRRVQGSLDVSRELDRLQPEPPLFPTAAEKRADVEEAERWGEGVFQPVPRRLAWWGIRRDRSALRTFAEGAKLHVPVSLAARTAGPIIWWELRTHGATDEVVREDLRKLPGTLEKINNFIEQGTIGGAAPNAADFQIATSVRLLMCLDDLRALFEGRPAREFAKRVVPSFPGRIRHVFPTHWLPRGGTSTQPSDVL